MIKLVIFDHSGTISDDRRPCYEANMRILEESGGDRISFKEWLKIVGQTPADFLENAGVKGLDQQEVYDRYKQVYPQINQEGIVPMIYPDAPIVLDTLISRGKRIAMVSLHPQKNIEAELSRYEILDRFGRVFGEVHDKASGIVEACRELSVSLSDAVYVCDTEFDIIDSRNAGVRSCSVATGYCTYERLVQEQPDFGPFLRLMDILSIKDLEQ